jgi:hypothetical protein
MATSTPPSTHHDHLAADLFGHSFAAVTSPAASWQMIEVTQASIFWWVLAFAARTGWPGRGALRALRMCSAVIGQPSW